VWWLALAVASIVVVILALLLGLVIKVLRQIDRHAARTHTVGKQIAQNTVALWTLEQTNRDLVAIRDAARGAGRGSGDGAAAAALSAVSHRVQGWLGGSDSGPGEDRDSS
jgi:type II secretory pathway component PulJ